MSERLLWADEINAECPFGRAEHVCADSDGISIVLRKLYSPEPLSTLGEPLIYFYIFLNEFRLLSTIAGFR